ncbi:MAG: FG-GAP-like repeat-containing protein [Candidatus Korobacteraceae bacterium]
MIASFSLGAAQPAFAQASTTADVVYGQGGSFTASGANDPNGVSASSLILPNGLVPDSSGNLYIADGNSRVLFYTAGSTTATQVYGQLGSFTTNIQNDGGISANSLCAEYAIALDSSGNLYVADSYNNRVLFYPSGSMTATRVYGQLGSFTTDTMNKGGISANSLYLPQGVALDSNGNLYVGDVGNNRVLFYPSGSTTATRVYGQGGSFTTNTVNKGGISASSLYQPQAFALDSGGNLYVADYGNSRVLFYPSGSTTATRVYGQSGSFTTNTPNNGGISANSLWDPYGEALDSAGNLYIVDNRNHRVLFYPSGSTTATQVYGQLGSFTTNIPVDGGVSANSLYYPEAVTLDSSGNLYIADSGANRVLMYPPTTTPGIYSPVNQSSLAGTSATFWWAGYPGASNYWLDIGSTPGGNNYLQSGPLPGSQYSLTAAGLPSNGSTVYVTWWYEVGGSWSYTEYQYTAFNVALEEGVLTTPTPGSTFSGSTVTFDWTAGSGASNYWLDVGSTPGGNNYYQSQPLGNVLTVTVNGLPTNGTPVYVTLYSFVGGQWLSSGYTYTAYNVYAPSPLSFRTAVNYGTDLFPYSVAVGDFNGDGKLDLVTVNYGANDASVLLGNGDGTFHTAVNYGVGSMPDWVTVGDFNRDGKLDLAVANECGNDPTCQSGGTVGVLLGNGDGTFQTMVSYKTGANSASVAVGDFNGDGKPDLVVTNYGSANVSVLLGNGDGTFQTAVNYRVGSVPTSVAVGDFNGDGKLDLAVSNESSNDVSVLLGNGDGTFQAAVNYAAGSGAYWVTAGDLRGNGKLDLVVANLAGNNVSVLLGNGDGTFQAAVNYGMGNEPESVALADFNGDGKPDLAVAVLVQTLSALVGNGDGTFQAGMNYGVGYGPFSAAVGDFNGDGKPDLVTANEYGSNLSILLNNTIFNEPAHIESPPPNSTLAGSTVTFQWDACDSATAYWIDLGSAPGGNQYYQSGSLPTTTFSVKVSGLPANGSTIYVTMYSLIGGQWYSNQYTYVSNP